MALLVRSYDTENVSVIYLWIIEQRLIVSYTLSEQNPPFFIFIKRLLFYHIFVILLIKLKYLN